MTSNNNYHEIIKFLVKDIDGWVDLHNRNYKTEEYLKSIGKRQLSKQSYELFTDVLSESN